jgi:GntR family transcriptional regulator
MLHLTVRQSGEEPIYQQIYEQIKRQVLTGGLPPEFPLPSIREAALELRISVITVKKAWERLEAEGLIYTVPGRGCYVAPLPEAKLERKRDEEIRERVRKDLEYYKSLGLTIDDIVRIFREADREGG